MDEEYPSKLCVSMDEEYMFMEYPLKKKYMSMIVDLGFSGFQ